MASIANNVHWAVRVQPSMETTHEILPASSSLLESSPSPFGMKICTLPKDDSYYGSSQRLFYVSKQAALDRDHAKHAMNGVGVRPGWYMIGEQGRFYVQVEVVKEKEFAKLREDGFIVSLKVDGQDTNDERLYKKAGTILEKGLPCRFKGIVKSRYIVGGTRVSNATVDLFCFEKISDASEGRSDGPTDTGTISMHVEAGALYKTGISNGSIVKNYEYHKRQVSAKVVAREGRSIRAGTSGLVKTESRIVSDCHIICRRELVAETLTVYVRSRSWLCSRRIIDDDDQPFTFVDFVKAQIEWSASAGMKRVQVVGNVVNGNEGPRKKKARVKKEMALTNGESQEQSAEVIDLT